MEVSKLRHPRRLGGPRSWSELLNAVDNRKLSALASASHIPTDASCVPLGNSLRLFPTAYPLQKEAGIAGWTTERSEFESQWGQGFLFLHVFQTSSGAHTASYPMSTVKLTNHLQLVPRPRKPEPIHPLPHTSSWRSA
jgi:hypothetical protein